MKLDMQVGLGHTVLDGDDPAPPSKKGALALLQFSAHVCYGQTAAWIKMTLGREVDLSPGDIVSDGDPAPPTQKGTAPNFRPMLWPNGWMDQDANW